MSSYFILFEQDVLPLAGRGRGVDKCIDIEAILGPLKKAVAALHSTDEGWKPIVQR